MGMGITLARKRSASATAPHTEPGRHREVTSLHAGWYHSPRVTHASDATHTPADRAAKRRHTTEVSAIARACTGRLVAVADTSSGTTQYGASRTQSLTSHLLNLLNEVGNCHQHSHKHTHANQHRKHPATSVSALKSLCLSESTCVLGWTAWAGCGDTRGRPHNRAKQGLWTSWTVGKLAVAGR